MFFVTSGVTIEDRHGGTKPTISLPAAGLPYVEALSTRRHDAGAVGQTTLADRYVLVGRFAVAEQRHGHQFGEVFEHDRHRSAFGEVTIRGTFRRNTWVGGVALEHEAYAARELPQFNYSFSVPGVFIQDDLDVAKWLSLSASSRFDHHNAYGTFLSPKLSALFRAGAWTSRISVGTGFFGPSPLTEETEASGLSRLTIPRPLLAEEGRSQSIDLSRSHGPLTYTLTLFASQVSNPIHAERRVSGVVLTNLQEPSTNRGIELLGTWRHELLSVTGTYTYVRARETVGHVGEDVPLTPRHSAGIVGMWEREGVGRVGVECYYTGVQRLEDNPYRDRSEPYFVVGLLAEKVIGRLRLFVNGENLNDVRQTQWDPLIRPTRASDGRWTVDAWAPLDGRNINGGVRVAF
jgi:iron complex outermembrane receptor protein